MSIAKYQITILFLLMISILFFNKVNAEVLELPLLGRIIYVDPGHGGYSYALVQ